jgi:hypothetical protein
MRHPAMLEKDFWPKGFFEIASIIYAIVGAAYHGESDRLPFLFPANSRYILAATAGTGARLGISFDNPGKRV